MFKKIIKKIKYFKVIQPEEIKMLNYLATAYPSNHTYKIVNKKIIPKSKLKKRYRTITALFPEPLESILDIGCSKGFFIFLCKPDAFLSTSFRD